MHTERYVNFAINLDGDFGTLQGIGFSSESTTPQFLLGWLLRHIGSIECGDVKYKVISTEALKFDLGGLVKFSQNGGCLYSTIIDSN